LSFEVLCMSTQASPGGADDDNTQMIIDGYLFYGHETVNNSPIIST
jgi:hypothetical protein